MRIHSISAHPVFTLEQARDLIPLVRKITSETQRRIEEKLSQSDPAQREATEAEVQTLFDRWQEKIARLGGVTKGMWLVDFDSGEGYYCWKFPEASLEHFHPYEQGYSSRVRLS